MLLPLVDSVLLKALRPSGALARHLAPRSLGLGSSPASRCLGALDRRPARVHLEEASALHPKQVSGVTTTLVGIGLKHSRRD